MKTKKISLANMQGKLSRAEMKNIIGGQEEFKNQTDDIIGDGESAKTNCYAYCVNNHAYIVSNCREIGDVCKNDGGYGNYCSCR